MGEHHYFSFGLCFPSHCYSIVHVPHPAPVCSRPVGPSMCASLLFTPDPPVFSLDALIQHDSQPLLFAEVDTEILTHVGSFRNISTERLPEQLQRCSISFFLCPLWKSCCCRTKLRRYAIAAGCVEFLHLVLWCGGGEESQSL